MKFLVLLSLVAFCSSLPTSFDKHVTVDVHRVNQYDDVLDGQLVRNTQKQWQQPNYGVLKSWNEQLLTKEPRNQWVDSDYVRDFNELDNVTPSQRVQLLLKHIKLQSQKNQWNSDVSEEEYLKNMLSQYLPEYVEESKLTHEQMVPQLVHYFEQNPLKYQHVMQEVMPTQWTVQQVMKHLVQQVYQHHGEAPWTREQIRQHVVKYQQYLGNNPLNYHQLEQLVELAYRLQFELNQWNTEQVEQTPWTAQHVMKHLVQQVYQHHGEAPWTREQIRQHVVKYQQYLGNNPLNYHQLEQLVELAYRLQFELNQWNTEQVEQTPWTAQHVMQHLVQQIHQHHGEAPWTREQIRQHIVKYQQYLGNNPLDYQQLEQLVELAYHLQFELNQWNTEQTKMNPWAHFSYNINQRNMLNEQEYQQYPWVNQKWEQTTEMKPWTHFLEDEYLHQGLSEEKEPQMWKSLNRYQQKNQKWNQQDKLSQLVEHKNQWNQNWSQQGELNQLVEQGQYLPEEQSWNQNWKHSWNPTWTQRWN